MKIELGGYFKKEIVLKKYVDGKNYYTHAT